MATLEEKIRSILLSEGKSAESVLKAASDYESDKDSDEDEKDSDDNSDDDKDDDSDDDTDISKDSTKKDTAVVKEDTAVPGTTTGKTGSPMPGKKLVDAKSEDSGAEKTSKMTAKYNKGTKQDKLPEASQSGSKDEKATGETSKITAAYKSTTMPKLKEEAISALFSGETLTEEFKLKAEAIFEAAVEQVAEAKVQELQEEYQLQLTEAIDEVKGELVEQIDGYLDYVIEQWMEDNAVALESGIKVEMASSFMDGMKTLFEEHYIDVPESKVDVIEEQANQISELENELAEAKEEAEKAINETQILKCEAIIVEHQTGLSAIEAEKLYSLAENIEFDTEEEFSSKVKSLKESYFPKNGKLPESISTKATEAVKQPGEHSDVAAVLRVLKENSLKLIHSSN